ncbi:MAG TPA: hypothetical protein VJT49_08910 [Amycolatopsis sp.]|uniref:hypothetical protein n=1 Tax=Amycolatopsis sp. TaxID=37632 RepID=UPI002B48D375|nr:hypothetical protein [Amycolatopsis sp.]HKS45221.1 hypothetical protein [Amycolatopsis sp.]
MEFGTIVGKASVDGVTVEVGVGGRPRSVEVSPRAMRYGAAQLARMVVAVAAHATAKANHRAHQLYGDRVIDGLGLTYDPALIEDDFDQDWTRG